MTRPTIFGEDRVAIAGVLNATPDSFSDGGRFVSGASVDIEKAVSTALAMIEAGADLVDIGGESTRPGSKAVSVTEEISRTIPVIEALAKASSVPISIDTRKAEVAHAALEAGATLINDVSGLNFDPRLAAVAAESGSILILGHARGTPETMQEDPQYENVLEEVAAELERSRAVALKAGVGLEQLVFDPGIGFGKRLQDNLDLLANVAWLKARLGRPILIGPSRKSFLGELTGDPVVERDTATTAACAAAVFAGADAIRVHDVASGRRAVQVGLALRQAKRRSSA